VAYGIYSGILMVLLAGFGVFCLVAPGPVRRFFTRRRPSPFLTSDRATRLYGVILLVAGVGLIAWIVVPELVRAAAY